MKVLVIGSGAREHAICMKIKESNLLNKLYCIPGNAGIQDIAECEDITIDNLQNIVQFCKNNNIDYVIVGPEAPLVNGLVDILEENNIKCFGPKKEGAILEGSKTFSKTFMKKYDIPTANYNIYNNYETAINEIKSYNLPVVLKADGLAAGKGVLICNNYDEATQGIKDILKNKKFGNAGNSLLVEEFLTGTEASLLCFVNGKDIIPMESARDYKRALDNNLGLNTGGMGCFSPNTIYTDKLNDYIRNNILDNIIEGFNKENIDFRGILFIGLMIKNNTAKVLEFNVRFGDPETEVVLPRLECDLLSIMLKTSNGTLKSTDLKWNNKPCVTVVLASGGYPKTYNKGEIITGLNMVDTDIIVYHAGTKYDKDNIVTNGGRVLAITCLSDTIEEARNKIYNNIDKIKFNNMQYRKDIACNL